MDLKYIVYITVNQCNGKFYIGVHQTNPDVFDGYIGNGVYRPSLANTDTAFHRAVRKYGYENFKRTTIEVFDNMDDAYDLESMLVTPTLLRSKQCYNSCVGGIRRDKTNEAKRVYQFSLDGEFLRSYASARQAALALDTSKAHIIKSAIKNNCVGSVQSAFGYVWSYKKEFIAPVSKKHTPVAQYSMSGKFIRSYNSIAEAEREHQLCTIYQAAIKNYTAGGYRWRFYNGDDSDIVTFISRAYKNSVVPIIATHIETGESKEYDSINSFIKEHPECSTGQVNRVLRHVNHYHKGYTFKYKDEDIVQMIQK